MTILDKIIAQKKKDLAARRKQMTEASLRLQPGFSRKTYSLAGSITKGEKSGIIAEFKRRSPSKGVINAAADVWQVTSGYTSGGASCLSVLTDEPFFGGKTADLMAARANEIPLLRKDFIIDAYQVLEAKAIGADVILLIAACLQPQQVIDLTDYAHTLGLEVLLEFYAEEELSRFYDQVDLVGINNRDLKTFKVDIDNAIRLRTKLPGNKPAIAESGISDPRTLLRLKREGFSGFLMGEHFMKTTDPAAAFADYVNQIKLLENEA